ncbi:MAG TPA: hypothetical protein VF327_00295, partial [Gaiellaceae bacterium]
YGRPVNLFVASFIGSPAMNVVEAELHREADGLRARFGPHDIRIDANVVREGQEHEEQAEEAALDTAGEGGVVGSRPNLVAQYPAHVMLRLTEHVPVAVDVARMHFFDSDTGDPLR